MKREPPPCHCACCCLLGVSMYYVKNASNNKRGFPPHVASRGRFSLALAVSPLQTLSIPELDRAGNLVVLSGIPVHINVPGREQVAWVADLIRTSIRHASYGSARNPGSIALTRVPPYPMLPGGGRVCCCRASSIYPWSLFQERTDCAWYSSTPRRSTGGHHRSSQAH